MNFFQHQDRARKQSRVLVFYFILAVLAIVLTVHLATSALLFWVKASAYETFDWWEGDRLVFFGGGTLLVILGGSLSKIWQLSGGGALVAGLLGGRPIDPNTTRLEERRVVNVVEEMAIASGLPVPTVYLLDREQGINAFAAGFGPEDAVIGVTRGAVSLLSRDELQGVVAHEFSHIVNGDTRLNLRLMGVLHGILLIALIGYFILRSSLRVSSSRKKGAAPFFPLFGLALVVIGYLGVFFGRVIKSAVSRQREFLADAAAVQFTRNPSAVGGALKKIGGLAEGSLIMSPHAEQASHFFFSDGKYGKTRRLFAGVTHFDFLATHPPLEERIRRVDPRWDGVFPEVAAPVVAPSALDERKRTSRRPAPHALQGLLPAGLIAGIGALDQEHLAYAAELLSRIPERVREAAHEPSGARAVVLALVTDREPAARDRQLGLLAAEGDELLSRDTREMMAAVGACPRPARLPLVDLTLPALKRLSPAQYRRFAALLDAFIRADRRIDLFELTLSYIVQRRLGRTFEHTAPAKIELYGLATLRRECSVLLSAVAHSGDRDERAAAEAFAEGARDLRDVSLAFLSRSEVDLAGLRDALSRIERVAPRLKRDLLRALVAIVVRDGKIGVVEGEMLRAIAEAIGLPMPPLLPGQELARTAAAV